MTERRVLASEVTSANVSLFDKERQEAARTFFDALYAAQPAIRFRTGPADGGRVMTDIPTDEELLFSLKGQSIGLKDSAEWGERHSSSRIIQEQALKKTWLIEKVNNDGSHRNDINIICSTAVTREFRARVHKFLNDIPEELRAIVASKGTQILLVENAHQIDPNLASQHARRYPHEEVLGNLPAFYHPQLNAMVLSEKPEVSAQTRLEQGKIYHALQFLQQMGVRLYQEPLLTADQAVSRCTVHEFGHALDNALSNFTTTHEFNSAFHQDLEKLSEADKKAFRYFVAPESNSDATKVSYDAAKQELFAELFAVCIGMKSALIPLDQSLAKKFPNVVKVMRSRLTGLCKPSTMSKLD